MESGARPPSGLTLWIGGSVLLWLLYSLVFLATSTAAPLQAMRDAVANVLPLALLAAATHALLKAWIMPLAVPLQAAAHAALALAFAVTWYALTIVLLAFFGGLGGRSWSIEPFWGAAFTWQSFQGLILYGFVAAVCYAIRGGRAAAPVTIVEAPPLERYLVRDDDGMRPIDIVDIVLITGAQDYAEVTTKAGRHLVRMSLAEFETRLDRRRFLRVHRSAIINIDSLRRADPAGGGRMTAEMNTGDMVPVSRAGARLLRTLMV